VLLEPAADTGGERSLTRGREQLEVGVLQAEERVRGAVRGMAAMPGRLPPEEAPVGGGGAREVADGEHDVVEAGEHAAGIALPRGRGEGRLARGSGAARE
jgi:hypothetical protein